MSDDMAAQHEPGAREINDVQRLHFELLRSVQYNLLDGSRVVDDLLAWRPLWYAVLPDRCARSTGRLYQPVADLIRLRDMPRGYWNVDSVFIWTSAHDVERLLSMIRERWQADAVELLDPDEMFLAMMATMGTEDRVISVWWD